MLGRVALVRTDVSEEISPSFIRVTRIGELRTTLAVINNQSTLQVFLRSGLRLLDTASVVPSSPILVTLMKEGLISSETSVLTEPHGVTSQKTPFFSINLTDRPNMTNKRVWNTPFPSMCCLEPEHFLFAASLVARTLIFLRLTCPGTWSTDIKGEPFSCSLCLPEALHVIASCPLRPGGCGSCCTSQSCIISGNVQILHDASLPRVARATWCIADAVTAHLTALECGLHF
jgi:hypothetical protein